VFVTGCDAVGTNWNRQSHERSAFLPAADTECAANIVHPFAHVAKAVADGRRIRISDAAAIVFDLDDE
jgi:hypothetical protein